MPERTLTDALWPDEEGDAAHAAYTMTLSRLRKLLGDASLAQQRGAKLSLDQRKCWVDAWAFEQCANEADAEQPSRSCTNRSGACSDPFC